MTLSDSDIYARVSDDDGNPFVTTDASREDKADAVLETPEALAELYDSFSELVEDYTEWAILRDRQDDGTVRCHTLAPAQDIETVEVPPMNNLLVADPQHSIALGEYEHLSTRYFNEMEIIDSDTLFDLLDVVPADAEREDRGTDWSLETDSLDAPVYFNNRHREYGNTDWVVAFNSREQSGDGANGSPYDHEIFIPVDDIEFTESRYGYGLDIPSSARMYWDGPDDPGLYQVTISHMYLVNDNIVPPEGRE